MAVTLRALVDALSTVRVRLGPGHGELFQARVLSGLEHDLLARLNPRPSPPKVRDPNKGSLAPLIDDLNDPKFKAAEEGWYFNHVTACVAAGLGGTAIGLEGVEWPAVSMANHCDLEVRRAAAAFLAASQPLVARVRWPQLEAAYIAIISGVSAEGQDEEDGPVQSPPEAAAKN